MIAKSIQAVRVAHALIREAIDGYITDHGDLLAAALAFYTLFAMAPLALIATVITGFILGRETARAEISTLVSENIGAQGATAVDGLVDAFAASVQRSGVLASLIAGGLTVFAASKLFQQLRRALNQIWNVKEVMIEWTQMSSVWTYVRQRALAFLLVIASAPILLIVFASRALLSGVSDLLFRKAPWAATVVSLAQFAFSVLLVWGVTALLFRYVSDKKLEWSCIRTGAFVTSLISNVGNIGVGLYLGRATPSSTYGAAGSLIVVLLWLKFSTSIFLFGAELTQVYAKRRNA